MSRADANKIANKIVTLLADDPRKGEMVRDGVTGFRATTEEVWVQQMGVWVRLTDMCIHARGGDYYYPGPIKRWAMRKFFAWWRDQVPLPPVCTHPDQTQPKWSQDGSVSKCRTCRGIVYHGDGEPA